MRELQPLIQPSLVALTSRLSERVRLSRGPTLLERLDFITRLARWVPPASQRGPPSRQAGMQAGKHAWYGCGLRATRLSPMLAPKHQVQTLHAFHVQH